jgi:hypothetical protein
MNIKNIDIDSLGDDDIYYLRYEEEILKILFELDNNLITID